MSRNLKWRIMRKVQQLEAIDSGVGPAVLSYELRARYGAVTRCCIKCVDDGLLWYDKGAYRLTADGRHALGCIPTGQSSDADREYAWRQEALAGMTDDGRETRIVSGAMPTAERHYRADQDEIIDMRRQLARSGITVDDLVDGSVCQCRCGQIMLRGQVCCVDD